MILDISHCAQYKFNVKSRKISHIPPVCREQAHLSYRWRMQLISQHLYGHETNKETYY